MGEVSPEPLGLVAAAYGMQLKEHGTCPTGVLWGNLESQQSRFDLLARLLVEDDSSDNLTINDLGCGYGAFFEFLEQKALLKDGRYFGYDISDAMVAAAKDRISDSRARFLQSMLATELAHYSFASGTFNLKGTQSDDAWGAYVNESLRWLWEKSSRGMGFNILDGARETEPKEWLYYPTPDEVEAFCRQSFDAVLTRIDGDDINDCTFLLRRIP